VLPAPALPAPFAKEALSLRSLLVTSVMVACLPARGSAAGPLGQEASRRLSRLAASRVASRWSLASVAVGFPGLAAPDDLDPAGPGRQVPAGLCCPGCCHEDAVDCALVFHGTGGEREPRSNLVPGLLAAPQSPHKSAVPGRVPTGNPRT
jgi:hypothetical protein